MPRCAMKTAQHLAQGILDLPEPQQGKYEEEKGKKKAHKAWGEG